MVTPLTYIIIILCIFTMSCVDLINIIIGKRGRLKAKEVNYIPDVGWKLEDDTWNTKATNLMCDFVCYKKKASNECC